MKKTMKIGVIFTIFLLVCVSVLATYLTSFSQVDTTLNLSPSVTINGNCFDEPIENILNITSGNKKSIDIIIENHCNEGINISVIHTDIQGINVFVKYDGSKINFPFLLDPNTEYNAKIVYKTNHKLKPDSYLITSDFIFVD